MVFELTVKGHTIYEIEHILHVSHGTVCGDMKEIRQPAKQVIANYFNETLLLRSLQEILHNRIIQKKGEIHESHNRVYNERIWTEIEETLQWVLTQILTMLLRRSQAT
jgi:hypothetical protein